MLPFQAIARVAFTRHEYRTPRMMFSLKNALRRHVRVVTVRSLKGRLAAGFRPAPFPSRCSLLSRSELFCVCGLSAIRPALSNPTKVVLAIVIESKRMEQPLLKRDDAKFAI